LKINFLKRPNNINYKYNQILKNYTLEHDIRYHGL
jgi:hypothetical protein